jgi:hypothetical protein
MKVRPRLPFAISGLLAVALAASLTTGFRQGPPASLASDQGRNNPSDPRQAMIAALGADRPHPSLGDEARTFDRLVGTWDCEFTFHLDDGKVVTKKGELEFGWILDGRAVQDIWTTYPAENGKERSSGTSLRVFDSKSKQWRVVFIQPQYAYIVTVAGGREGDRIVLRGTDTDGALIRWTFLDIADNSFNWHGEKSRDRGQTWVLEEDHRMRRRL